MNAKRWMCLLIFLMMAFFSACSPAASPTAIAKEPARSDPADRSAAGGPEPAPPEPKPEERIAEAPLPLPTAAPAAAYPEEMPVPPAPPDNQFKDYGVNPETDTRYDHLSTFALDVDTASYTVTRRYIHDGSLPPYDAVRAEEFVNFFDQGYEAPRESAFTIYADGAPAPREYDEGAYILRFGVQGARLEDFERKPSVLTFVIDTSGSMEMENRLGLVKRSLRLLVENLDERDSVAIVQYGSTARAVLKPTNASRKGVILDAIDSLYSDGSTNAEAGIRLGYRYAQSAFQEGANNRVILCSDGVANVGNIDPETILSEVQSYVDTGITMTTIGVGMGNFNDVLLENLADRGDGFYAYVDDIDEARKVFVEDLTSTLQVIAMDAKVQVDFNPEVVESYRLIGYENRAVADSDFRNNEVDAGEIGAGHTATALYMIRFKPEANGRIATVQLRWQDPDTREVKEINGNYNTWDISASHEESGARYQLAVAAAEFAEILRESPYTAAATLDDVAFHAHRISRMLPEDEEAAEFADLTARAAELRR